MQPGLDDFPIFYTKEERDLLKGSPTLEKVDDLKETIEHDWKQIRNHVDGFNYTQTEYAENIMLISSRNFGVTMNGTHHGNIQVPFADMFNTQVPKNASWSFDNDKRGFRVIAHKDIAENEQVFDTYGNKCNSRYFLNYGFIHSDNERFNEYELSLNLTKTDPQFDGKIKVVLGSAFKAIKTLKLMNDLSNPVFFVALSWCRFLVYNDDLKALKKQIEDF